MRELNIPKKCKNCEYSDRGRYDNPCRECGNHIKFKSNSMFDETYERGVKDMSDVFRKIYSSPEKGGYSAYELNKIFPDRDVDHIFLPLSILESYGPLGILQRIQEYEENKNELHVGDVVRGFDDCTTGIITKISKRNNMAYVLWKDGSCGEHEKKHYINNKPGENMTIPEFLEKYGRIGE